MPSVKLPQIGQVRETSTPPKVEVTLLALEMGSRTCLFARLLDVEKFEIYKDGPRCDPHKLASLVVTWVKEPPR